MKIVRALLAGFLLLSSAAPAHADFKYTETSQMTGGSLLTMVKFVSKFSHGDSKKQEKDMLQPTTRTHYVKGDRLRTDNEDGTSQIIDVGARRVIFIDNNNKTYAVATFDQIKAAMEQAAQQMQQQAQQNPQTPQQKPVPQDVQLTLKPTVKVTPGGAGRTILGQATNETNVEIDLAMQGTATGPDAPPPGQPNSATFTSAMHMDTYVAPNVTGYLEFAQFYRRLGEEVSWMKIPSMPGIQIDPRAAEGMSELQKNSDALKGFPMLSYVSMTMSATADGQTQNVGAQNNAASNPNASNPPASQTDNSPSSLEGAAVMKGLGGMFGRKKKDSDSAPAASTLPPNPHPDPNALMEMTTAVTAFSTDSLDTGLFDVPAGFQQVQEDPMQVFGGGARTPQQPTPRK
ncbi:MAG TPA: hypothetical protein VIH76_14580 [Candidatus Acidoferrales bacterium]